LWESLDGFGGIAVRANAERILSINLEEIRSFVQNSGKGLVVHDRKINQSL
jgi:hypothetical protein